jgi:uncharacterized protein (DUF433 family)
MKKEDIFHSDPEILGRAPVFTGARVPVNTLTVHLKHGKRLDEFLDDFPSVKRRQAEAFLEKAEQTLLGDGDARAA